MRILDSVISIDEELQLSVYKAELSAETGYWNKLQQLRAKAAKGQGIAAYKTLLKRGIERLEQRKADALDGANQEKAAREFLEWLSAERQRLGIPNVERNRGRSVEEWCEKWQPRAFQAYRSAFKAMCEAPSGEALTRLKTATTALLETFANPPVNAS